MKKRIEMKNLINLGTINSNSVEISTFVQYAKRYGISIVKVGVPRRGSSTRHLSIKDAKRIVDIFFHNRNNGSYIHRYAGTSVEETVNRLYTYLKENHPEVYR